VQNLHKFKMKGIDEWKEILSFIASTRLFLLDIGKVSHEVAEALALKEYEKYRVVQDKNYISDFDREVKNILDAKKKKKR